MYGILEKQWTRSQETQLSFYLAVWLGTSPFTSLGLSLLIWKKEGGGKLGIYLWGFFQLWFGIFLPFQQPEEALLEYFT